MDPLYVDTIISKTPNGPLSLSGNGTGLVHVIDGLVLPPNSGSATPPIALDHYSVWAQPVTFGGAILDQAVDVQLLRLGRIVVATFPAQFGGASAGGSAIYSKAAIPAAYRPPVNTRGPALVINNSGADFGSYQVRADGIIYFGLGAGLGNFWGIGNAGVYPTTLVWAVQ
jgi:hypothetical protein